MVFDCKECGRCLPNFMEKESNRCIECITGDVYKNDNQNKKKSNQKNTRQKITQKSAEPEIVKIENRQETSSEEHNISDRNEDSNDNNASSNSVRRVSNQPSTEPTAQIYFRKTPPDHFSNLYCCDVFCMGWYDSNDYKTDPFSTKIIDYCKRGNTETKESFINQLDGFIETRLQNEIEADFVTIYPGHDGKISKGLLHLANHLESKYSIQYKHLLKRTEERPSQKEQGTNRWENQYGSIDVKKQLNGEFVLLLDDIVTSGASVTIGKTELMKAGAENVIAIGLGATRNQDQKSDIFTKPTPTVREVINNE